MRQNFGGRRSFRALALDKLFIGFFFVMLVYTFYNLFLSQYNVFKVLDLKRGLIELNKKIAHQRLENDKREQLMELIKENPEHFKEKFVREYMQLQKDGEYILLLKD